MRVLVIGATGYIGSRLIGALLERDDTVIAGARDLASLDAFWWSDRVERVPLDVLEEDSVRAAVTADVDAIVYLVHGMAAADFVETDAAAARHLHAAVDAVGVRRVVYLSGIIPPIPEEELSEHLRSRLQVERELSASSASVITLRAAMIIGSGSTSFELMTQLSERLPVVVVPDWMRREVEPIAVIDVVSAIVGALDVAADTMHLDVGGGERLPYPDLIERVAAVRDTERPQWGIPLLPEALVAKIASWIADVPGPTVEALMESLREDMVAQDDTWVERLECTPPLALTDALERASTASDPQRRPSRRDPMAALPGDPDWASEIS
ncbi:NAD(P)H-binding protein [Microbacterium gorillae]|uniref:NAD(P)H-binding protein n=1 Tax=Microbacterium gorillae TaxID=1231063 RepID=UPI0005905C2B|nr:NAD(P)H-binding protein [Microbacterium gorillae]